MLYMLLFAGKGVISIEITQCFLDTDNSKVFNRGGDGLPGEAVVFLVFVCPFVYLCYFHRSIILIKLK